MTLPGYFKAAGDIVTGGGKIFHPEEPNDNDPVSWTDVAAGASCTNSSDHGPCTRWQYSFGGYDGCKNNVSTSCPGCHHGSDWCAVDNALETADEKMAAVMTQRLRDIVASKTTRPFFMSVGFLKPHLPYAAPVRYYDAVDKKFGADGFPIANASGMQMPLGAPRLAWYDYFASLSTKEGKSYCHDASLKSSNCKGAVPMTALFPPAPLRDLTRAYGAAISMVDEQFGKLISTLDELSLTDKTVVAFIGDQ